MDRDTGTRFGTLHAAARGLAETRARTAPNTRPAFARALVVSQLIELHDWFPIPRPARGAPRRGSFPVPKAYPQASFRVRSCPARGHAALHPEWQACVPGCEPDAP